MNEIKKNSRRKLLNWGLWASAGIVTGAALRGYMKRITHKRTRYISADGTTYEVTSSRFFNRKKKKVTNAELKSWIGDRY